MSVEDAREQIYPCMEHGCSEEQYEYLYTDKLWLLAQVCK